MDYCPHCGTKIKQGASSCDRCGLVGLSAPEERNLNPLQERVIIDEVHKKLVGDKQFHKAITSNWRFWLMFFVYFILLAVLFGGSYWRAKRLLDRITTERLDELNRNTSNRIVEANTKIDAFITQQFAEARVSNTVEGVAANQAKELMLKQIQPEVQRFRSEIDGKLAGVEAKVNEVTNRVEAARSNIKDIEEVTKGMISLPDGRVVMGGMVTGRAWRLMDDLENLMQLTNARKFDEAYPVGAAAIKEYEESAETTKNIPNQIGNVVLNPDGLSKLYWNAAQAAYKTSHFDDGMKWARKAVQQTPSPAANAVLARALFYAGQTNEAARVIQDIEKKSGSEADEFKRLLGL